MRDRVPDLLPCPFCGGIATMVTDIDEWEASRGQCGDCDALGPYAEHGIDGIAAAEIQATALWNTRTAPEPPAPTDVKGAPADAVERADYLIDRYRRLWRGEAVRDLDEAEGSWASAKAALQPIEGAGMLREALAPFARWGEFVADSYHSELGEDAILYSSVLAADGRTCAIKVRDVLKARQALALNSDANAGRAQ